MDVAEWTCASLPRRSPSRRRRGALRRMSSSTPRRSARAPPPCCWRRRTPARTCTPPPPRLWPPPRPGGRRRALGDAMGHGADAGEDAETALASTTARRCSAPLSQASVGRRPGTARCLSSAAGTTTRASPPGARGRADARRARRCPPRRRAPRRVARRGVRARRRRPGARHVELARLPPVAAARPKGHVPVRGGRSRRRRALGRARRGFAERVTPRKMLFAEDKAALGAGDHASASDDVDRTLHLEKQVGHAPQTRWTPPRRAGTCGRGARRRRRRAAAIGRAVSPDAARSARRRTCEARSARSSASRRHAWPP